MSSAHLCTFNLIFTERLYTVLMIPLLFADISVSFNLFSAAFIYMLMIYIMFVGLSLTVT